MKKVNIFLLIGILTTAISFTSCEKLIDEIQDAVELTINTNFEAPFVVTPTATKANTEGSYEFKKVVILNPSQNDDLSDYLNKIQSIDITGIQILVTSISDPNIVLNSSVFTLVDNVTGATFTYSTPANTAIAVGTKFQISETNSGWETINQIISDMHASTITAVGSMNQDNFKIGFKYIISVKVVAKP